MVGNDRPRSGLSGTFTFSVAHFDSKNNTFNVEELTWKFALLLEILNNLRKNNINKIKYQNLENRRPPESC